MAFEPTPSKTRTSPHSSDVATVETGRRACFLGAVVSGRDPIRRPRRPAQAPPPLGAVLRTLRGAAVDVPITLARFALDPILPHPATTSAAGLAATRAWATRALERLGIDLRVGASDRVPRHGGLIFMWNQESHLEHLVLPAAIPRPFFCLFNNEVARFPFYGKHMYRSRHVHLDRSDEAQWRPALAGAARRVAEGECALISPEGTRSWDGELLPMKRGAFLLAAASGCPIVCVTVVGGHDRLPRGAFVVRPGPIDVAFSEPISTAGLEANEDQLGPLVKRVTDVFRETKRAMAGATSRRAAAAAS
jgi:1-acyl-sn-glycerol-3-phosphate acyltransferase